MKALLIRYVKYNYWANDQLLNFIGTNCKDDMQNQEIVSSFPSIRKTFLHIWGAESIWLLRHQGESPVSWTWMEYTGLFEELRKEILKNNRNWISFVESATEEYFLRPFNYRAVNGKEYSNIPADTILHCMNHSAFHRGQVVTILRQLGFTKLPATDYIEFCRTS